MRSLSRLAYRLRQFKLAFFGPWPEVPDSYLSPYLSPALSSLFHRMTASEQVHSRAILECLLLKGYTDPDLLVAALLHDVGKTRFPLSVWERSLIVLGKHFLPRRSHIWGQGEAYGWKRPYVVAARHPAWGAELAAATGASRRVCELILRHQDPSPGEDSQLAALQQADDFK